MQDRELIFAGQRTHLGENWFEAHNSLALEKLVLPSGNESQLRMPTIPEFIEALKWLKIHNPELYNEITEIRSPWRANWLDAYFQVIKGVRHINYNRIFNAIGTLIPRNSEPLDEDTLMKDRTPGISLDSWLENPTSQGLVRKKTQKGDLWYFYPRKDDNSVARFSAIDYRCNLNCKRNPSIRYAYLGVFAVAQGE